MSNREVRAVSTDFKTRETGDDLHIEGYFSVFDSVYQIAPDMSESVDRHAFDKTLDGDIRALINHDTSLVLGRTKAGTLSLRTDDHGLYGDIIINPNDNDAMSVYARVKRGDVDQCSFGFNILKESTEIREDGSVHWTIEDVELFEVSVCTFPAYDETSIKARSTERDEMQKRKLQAWKEKLKGVLHNA